VLQAKTGPEGLEMAMTQQPDLILMDVSLPGIDGWEATKTLKGNPETSGIPIIVLTAHALQTDRQQAYEAGANGYVAKPANPMTVVDAVQRTINDDRFAIGFEDMRPRAETPPL
jgi:CheY-like chemotaxis protein